ncbi:MAG: tetratricopeptide repeat protein [Nitrospiraceae bacterium]|nr:tetratricopeptide repeat protein [Nitrospiraceae bacterium]
MQNGILSLNILKIALFILLISCADVYASALPNSVTKHADSILSVSIIDKDSHVIHSENSLILSKNGIVAASCYAVSRWFDSSSNRMIFTLGSGRKIPADFMLSDRCERGVAYIKIDASGLPVPTVPIASGRSAVDSLYLGSLESGKPSFTKVKTTGQASGSFKITSMKQEMSGPVFNSKGELAGLHMLINYVKGPYYSGIPSAPIKASLNRYTALMRRVDEALAAAATAKKQSKTAITQPEFKETAKADTAKEPGIQPAKPVLILPEHERLFNEALTSQEAYKYADAVDAYKKAVRIKHDFLKAHINLGMLLFSMGSYSESADAFRTALRFNPNSGYLNNRLGTALLAAGRYAAANEAFRHAVKLNPADTEAHFNLGVAQFIIGNRQDAWVQYVILKELDTEKAKKLLNLIN